MHCNILWSTKIFSLYHRLFCSFLSQIEPRRPECIPSKISDLLGRLQQVIHIWGHIGDSFGPHGLGRRGHYWNKYTLQITRDHYITICIPTITNEPLWGEFGQFSKSVCMLVSMISLDIFVAMFSVLEKLFRRNIYNLGVCWLKWATREDKEQ